jgi:hypothetical protein
VLEAIIVERDARVVHVVRAVEEEEALSGGPDEGGHQGSSEAMRGHQRHSAVIKGSQGARVALA